MKHQYSLTRLIFAGLLTCITSFILVAGTIEVDGVRVTDQNATNVLANMGSGKDGCVSYNADSRTLTLKNALLDKGVKIIGEQDEVTILIDGECSITADPFGLYTDGYVTVTGKGLLHVTCQETTSGAFAMDSERAVLRFKDCSVKVEKKEASFAVASLQRGRGLLVFDHAQWESEGLVGAMNRISIKRSDIKQPLGGRVGVKRPEGEPAFSNILDADGNPNYGTFQLEPNDKYPLRIDDVDVTVHNAANVFPNSVVPDGYVRYDPENNYLIVSNLDFFNMNVPNIENFHDETDKPLTIEVRGDCNVWSVYSSIYSRGPLIITGDGNLRIKTVDLKLGAAAISIDNRQTLTIKNSNVYATGFFGIAGLEENSAHIIIEDAYVEMTCTQAKKGGACLVGFETMDLKNVSVRFPEGAYFDPEFTGLVLPNGQPATDRVVIGNDKWSGTTTLQHRTQTFVPNVSIKGDELTIDLTDVTLDDCLARLYDISGVCLATVAPSKTMSVTLDSGVYIISCGDWVDKVVMP